MTNVFGLNIGSMTGAGTHTNVPYGIYISGSTDYNSITGNTIIGSTLTNPIPTSTGSLTIDNKGVANSQLVLRSQRAAIVSGNVLGGIDFQSNDTNLTAPGTVTASIQALATATHTASVLTTDLVFYTTNTLTYAEAMRITGAGVLSVVGVTVPTISSTSTLTNKRITARIGTETSSATSTPTADSVDQWNVTALAVADAFAAPTGTPTDGQKLIIRIKDN